MNRYEEALQRLEDAIARAGEAGLTEPTGAALATVSPEGRPRARVVLVRDRDARGLCFFTNLESGKAVHLRHTPFASLCFWYGELGEQIIVEGSVAPVSDEEADDYWRRRPREHQLGAWASDQSRPLLDREHLEARYADVERRYEGRPVPRPEHWSGFRLVPDAIEFWKFKPSRLHERERYHRDAEGRWTVTLLQP